MEFNIQEHVKSGPSNGMEEYKDNPWSSSRSACQAIRCANGFTVSIQASSFHYCYPRDDHGPYLEFELGFPSAQDDHIQEYAEDGDDPTRTVYGHVPLEVVEKMLAAHGGVVGLKEYEE